MSWNPDLPADTPPEALQVVIVPRARDADGFAVHRALPHARRQMVGPFIFFDSFGPVEMLSGQRLDIRPHPHIGLATVTWLFAGRLHHRDSLGTDRWIAPGEVNLMTAGRGITHSERTDGPEAARTRTLAGVQTWLALPETLEEAPPAFAHAADLPMIEAPGVRARIILGHAWGTRAPLPGPGETLYAEVALAPGAGLPLPDDHEDRAVHVLEGAVSVAGDSFAAGRMLVFRPGDRIGLRAGPAGARLMLLGGATLPGPRFVWWNFVASSRARIEAARADWAARRGPDDRFALPPGDDAEFVPLPAPRRPAG